MEPDFLDSAKTFSGDTSYTIQGVQHNLYGQREGYWLFGSHPGESNLVFRTGFASKFYPAEDVMHVYRKLRPGQ